MNIRADREAKKTMSHKRQPTAAAPPQISWQDVVMITFSRVRARQLQEQVSCPCRVALYNRESVLYLFQVESLKSQMQEAAVSGDGGDNEGGAGVAQPPDAAIAAADVTNSEAAAAAAAAEEERAASDAALGITHDTSPDDHELPLAAQSAAAAAAAAAAAHDQPAAAPSPSEVPLPFLNQVRPQAHATTTPHLSAALHALRPARRSFSRPFPFTRRFWRRARICPRRSGTCKRASSRCGATRARISSRGA